MDHSTIKIEADIMLFDALELAELLEVSGKFKWLSEVIHQQVREQLKLKE